MFGIFAPARLVGVCVLGALRLAIHSGISGALVACGGGGEWKRDGGAHYPREKYSGEIDRRVLCNAVSVRVAIE